MVAAFALVPALVVGFVVVSLAVGSDIVNCEAFVVLVTSGLAVGLLVAGIVAVDAVVVDLEL